MGWKKVKEHYKIEHHVQVFPEKGICIGSGYIHDLIVIGFDGVIKKRYADRTNKDLIRYQQEMDADFDKLRELVITPDVFDKSILVYTWHMGNIIEKQCEALDYPNATRQLPATKL